MSAADLPLLALTAGEPAGIGPDLCVALAHQPPTEADLVVIADPGLLRARAQALGTPITTLDWDGRRALTPLPAGTLRVAPVALAAAAVAGRLDPRNARYVLDTIALATRECSAQRIDALVTAPVHKGVINDAGLPFTGHTELLAELTGTAQVVMMLVGGGLRVALATTHLPLAAVPAALTSASLERTLRILIGALQRDFGLARPRILVAGLNPHAGESGHLGREEIDVIAPAIARVSDAGAIVRGPLPADTLFNPERLRECDAVLAMYHDQGLPVLKYASFGAGVNVTLGLPIIRTSVDHGTALDLAGSGRASDGSLREAIALAAELVRHARAAAGGASRLPPAAGGVSVLPTAAPRS
jgi:4-hydroxythreonine-4-phosphate dehydrogenase